MTQPIFTQNSLGVQMVQRTVPLQAGICVVSHSIPHGQKRTQSNSNHLNFMPFFFSRLHETFRMNPQKTR